MYEVHAGNKAPSPVTMCSSSPDSSHELDIKQRPEVLMVNLPLFEEVKKGVNAVAETAQCPAYSVQDGYKHARQSHTCILQYLQTRSEGCRHSVN